MLVSPGLSRGEGFISFLLLGMFCLVQPRKLLIFMATKAHHWIAHSQLSVHKDPQGHSDWLALSCPGVWGYFSSEEGFGISICWSSWGSCQPMSLVCPGPSGWPHNPLVHQPLLTALNHLHACCPTIQVVNEGVGQHQPLGVACPLIATEVVENSRLRPWADSWGSLSQTLPLAYVYVTINTDWHFCCCLIFLMVHVMQIGRMLLPACESLFPSKILASVSPSSQHGNETLFMLIDPVTFLHESLHKSQFAFWILVKPLTASMGAGKDDLPVFLG